jgi:uncharacterized ion transporter superfamily protein YfcC
MKTKFSLNTLVMIYAIVVVVAVLTWIVPGGEYQRETKEGRTLVIPGSFLYTQSEPQGLGAILMAPIKGFIQAAQIIAFLLIIGGVFSTIQRTGAITAAVQKMAHSGHHVYLFARGYTFWHVRRNHAVYSNIHTTGYIVRL